ncbi:pyridoxamine 5'-phosphate oxidase family protein [Sphingobium phenoxybenzoativorans]|uniref:pyridoxamine 5'-phosphate oxidase family protein n=1 Tax=Sphingobium phenoxybenzoativorans TaxID=1592790 RepID=UPI001FEA8198|nr:pyridoxamine 5'-phosphate oxidase family protein [Sphingobium phenoxybenzoativorans]
MKDIDFALLTTHTQGGAIGNRPMSNSREVCYDGDAWFFAMEATLMIDDIATDPKASLSYRESPGFWAWRPFFLAMEGHRSLIGDKVARAQHCAKGLERWWPASIETPRLH